MPSDYTWFWVCDKCGETDWHNELCDNRGESPAPEIAQLRELVSDFMHFVMDEVVWDDDMPKVGELASRAETLLHDTHPTLAPGGDSDG